MRKVAMMVVALTGIIFASGCGGPQVRGGSGGGAILAQVNQAALTTQDFASIVRELKYSMPDDYEIPAEYKQQVLEEWIRQELIAQESQKKGYDRDPQAAAWIETSRRQTLAQLAVNRDVIGAVTASEEEVMKFYEDNKDRYSEFRASERVRVSHILVDSEEQAKKIKSQLRSGAEFSGLVKKYSQDEATVDKGGDLGYIERGETLPEFERTAFGLKKNEIGGPVKTSHGWHLIKVTGSRKGGYKEYDEVKRLAKLGVLKSKREEGMKKYVERLRGDARIEQHHDLLKEIK